MKKFRYTRPLAILIVIIGAYHVLLFGLRPQLPPVAKTEVVWGDLSNKPQTNLQTPLLDTAFCTGATQATTGDTASAAAAITAAGKDRIRFEYRPVAEDIANTGHTVQITMDRGSSITIDGTTYHLKQFMFQKMAADAGHGSGQMAFYLVHRAANGKVAVVAVPLQLGKEGNPVITTLWRYMPKHVGEHNSLADIHIDINNLLPHDRSYYRYTAAGDCAKHVVWLGLQTPVTITATQLAKLDKALAQSSTSQSL